VESFQPIKRLKDKKNKKKKKKKNKKRRRPYLKALNYPPLRDLTTAIDKII
jgi:hypothetical protein